LYFKMHSVWHNTPSFLSPKKAPQCLGLDFEESMDTLLSEMKQIFVVMPAKASGSSLKHFTSKCMKRDIRAFPDNFVNFADMTKNFLTNSFEVPSIITSHLYLDEPLAEIAKHATRETLIIYIHREETSRALSAMKQVLTGIIGQKYCEEQSETKLSEDNQYFQNCTLDEESVVDIIEKRTYEIGAGAQDILTCKSYAAIEQNAPNMVILNHKYANDLQKLLAKHHCPEMSGDVEEKNLTGEKPEDVHIRLKMENGVVELEDWLFEKQHVIEWALQMKNNKSGCGGMTRHMEDDLFSCSEGAMKVSSENIRYW